MISRVALNDGASPYEVTLVRSVVAGIAVLAYLLARRRVRKPDRVTISVGVVMGVTSLATPFILGTIALQYASAGFVSLPAALIPLLTAALAHVLLPGERLSRAKVGGLVIALVGVVVLLAGDAGIGGGGRPVFAGILGLTSSVAIAFGSICAKRFAGRYDPLDVSWVQFVAGASVIAVAALAAGEGVSAGPAAAWPELILLGLVGTFLPAALYFWLLRYVTATYASVIGYVVPIFSVVLGIRLLDERLETGILVGGLLIMTGVIITDRLEARVRRS